MKRNLIFISAPFGNALDKELRTKQIARYSAEMMLSGKHVICPMSMGLALTKGAQLPNETEWWLKWTLNLLSRCDRMIVLCFDKWEESVGVQKEIEFALENNIDVEYEYFTRI